MNEILITPASAGFNSSSSAFFTNNRDDLSKGRTIYFRDYLMSYFEFGVSDPYIEFTIPSINAENLDHIGNEVYEIEFESKTLNNSSVLVNVIYFNSALQQTGITYFTLDSPNDRGFVHQKMKFYNNGSYAIVLNIRSVGHGGIVKNIKVRTVSNNSRNSYFSFSQAKVNSAGFLKNAILAENISSTLKTGNNSPLTSLLYGTSKIENSTYISNNNTHGLCAKIPGHYGLARINMMITYKSESDLNLQFFSDKIQETPPTLTISKSDSLKTVIVGCTIRTTDDTDFVALLRSKEDNKEYTISEINFSRVAYDSNSLRAIETISESPVTLLTGFKFFEKSEFDKFIANPILSNSIFKKCTLGIEIQAAGTFNLDLRNFATGFGRLCLTKRSASPIISVTGFASNLGSEGSSYSYKTGSTYETQSFVRISNTIAAEGTLTQNTFTYNTLDTPYYCSKMQQEGIYDDFISYMDEQYEYERLQRELEEQRQLEFESREDKEQSYEDWLSTQPQLMPFAEPQPSQVLLDFKKKYLG